MSPKTSCKTGKSLHKTRVPRLSASAGGRPNPSAWLGKSIPAAPCTELEALETDPHLAQVGLFRDYEHPSQGLCRETRAPVESRDVEEAPDRHPPELGEHTEEILREAGVSAEEIASMFSRGVLKGFAPEPA